MVIRIFTNVRKGMHEQTEFLQKERKYFKNYQAELTELKNTITELKINWRGSIAD